MPNTLQIKRGLQINLPTGLAGELLYTSDTKRLYIGDGATNNLLQGASSILTTGMVSFSDSSGKLTGSSSLYWDNTNGRLGIGTSSPTVPIHGLVNNQNIVARFEATGTGEGNIEMSGVAPQLRATTTNGASGFRVSIFGSTTGDVFRLQDSTTTLINVKKTGNVLIGTTTDAGFRLDVNGTARVSGDLTLSQISAIIIGNTWGTGKLNLLNGATAYAVFDVPLSRFRLSGLTHILHSTSTMAYIGTLDNFDYAFRTNNVERMRIFTTGNVAIGTTTDAGYKLDVNGTARVSGDMTIATASNATLTFQSNNSNIIYTAGAFGLFFNTTRVARFGNDGTIRFAQNIIVTNSTNVAIDSSAILQANSTTQGFLPPRMTTTQKNAIASPATGLQVYDTTLNQMSYYNGTTWTNI